MNVAKGLFAKLREKVYDAQAGTVAGLAGKHVVRDGVTFLVVRVDKNKVVVSDTKTPLKTTTTFSKRSFMSKAVEVLEPEGGDEKKKAG